jgi:hypothetical protein
VSNPIKLTVKFADGSEPVERFYTRGATEAVENMAKAMNWYTEKKINCLISLYDFRGFLIITHTCGVMPEEKEEVTPIESDFLARKVVRPD